MAGKLIKSSRTGGTSPPKDKLLCDKCGVELEMIEATFEYLTRSFRHKVPRCPECGQVSLPEELVNGKISDVEAMIEEN